MEIGSGVSILPADTVRQEVGSGVLAVVPFAPADAFRRPTGLLVKKTQTRRAAVRAFVEAMRAEPTLGVVPFALQQKPVTGAVSQ